MTVSGLIDAHIAKSPVIRFITAMKDELVRVDPTMPSKEAWNIAREHLRIMLIEEGIQFGAAGYDWTEDAARDLINELEIQYWEPSS